MNVHPESDARGSAHVKSDPCAGICLDALRLHAALVAHTLLCGPCKAGKRRGRKRQDAGERRSFTGRRHRLSLVSRGRRLGTRRGRIRSRPWFGRVGDIEAGDGGRISCYGIFRDAAVELMPVRRIVLSETLEAIGPRARSIGRDRLGIDRRAAPEQVDGNGGRARAIAVVVIIPGLHT